MYEILSVQVNFGVTQLTSGIKILSDTQPIFVGTISDTVVSITKENNEVGLL